MKADNKIPMSANEVVIVFRETEKEDVREKVFIDYAAKPSRAYPTGELYSPVEEGEDVDGLETITVFKPEDFTPVRYKRISDIPSGCIIKKEADVEA